MAAPFPASTGTVAQAWTGATQAASSIKANALNMNAQIAAGSVSAQTLLNMEANFAALNTQLTGFAAILGTAAGLAYVQAQVGNPTLDVAGAFNAMQAALVAAATWIMQNFPKDSANALIVYTGFDGSGAPIPNLFTSVQLAPLAALLTTLSATIN